MLLVFAAFLGGEFVDAVAGNHHAALGTGGQPAIDAMAVAAGQTCRRTVLVTLKELLLVTLPGVGVGFAATIFISRLQGKLWPVFFGIILSHTIGKLTIPRLDHE